MTAARDALVGSAGASFIARLQQALSVARLHDLSNAALDAPLEELRSSLAVVIGAQGTACVKPEESAQLVFLNDRVVRARKHVAQSFEPLIRALVQHGVGELRFERSARAEQLRMVLRAFRESANADPKEACRGLRRLLEQWSLPLSVLSTDEAQAIAVARSLKVDDAVVARLSYARSLALLRTFLDYRGEPELARYFWRKLVRGVQSLQALGARARHDLLAVTAIRDVEEPALHHALNTCILAILLGHHAGVSRSRMVPLGLAALLHSFGRSPTPAAPAREAYRGIAAFLGLEHMDDALLLSAVVSFQYEARRGHPETRAPIRAVHPLAKIVAIAEAYDGLISGPDAVRPDKAMAMLLQGKPRELDLALLGTFAAMMGTFPPGTAVEIDTGDVGIVFEPNPEDPNHPVVAIVRDREGRDVDGAMVDLATLLPSGRHAHNIKHAVDPVKLGLKIPRRSPA